MKYDSKFSPKFLLTSSTVLILFTVIYFTIRLDLSAIIGFVLFLNYLLLIGVLYSCKKGMELANRNIQQKGSSIIFILNLITFFMAPFISKVFVFSIKFYAYFFINNWMMNIGNKYSNPMALLDYKLLAVLIIPFITFLISKYIWDKKSKHQNLI